MKHIILNVGARPNYMKAFPIYEKLANILRTSFPDDRARTYDLVCLLIFLELNGGIFLSWIIFIIFVLKKFILFTYSIYANINKNWAEILAINLFRNHPDL